MRKMFLLIAGSAAILASCGEDKAVRDSNDDVRTAVGEVQGGTISDAMLPLDTVQSQSPPLRQAPASGDGGQTETADGPVAEDDSEEPIALPGSAGSDVPAPPSATDPEA